MQDENVTPDVSEKVTEADEAHRDTAQDQGAEAWGGEGNQPEGTGWQAPDTGSADGAESEIPVGVDAIEPAEGASGDGGTEPVDLANLDTDADAGGGDEPAGEAGAFDASAAADAAGADTADAEAAGADDSADAEAAGADDSADADADAEAAGADDSADAGAVDVSAAAEAPAAEDDAPAVEAEAEPPDTAEASAEPAGDDDEDEPVGDPDKFSGGGDIAVAGPGAQSAAEAAGEVPTEFRTPPGIPSGLDPGTPADRDQRV